MQELITQFNGEALLPSGQHDLETLQEHYKRNQLIRCVTYAVGKGLEPSVEQNNLLHACMQLVADNHPQLDTLPKVKFNVKVALNFIHEDRIAVRPDGTVQFEYRSFSFKELKNMERLNVFNRAFDHLAGLLSVSVDMLVAKAKEKMFRFR